MTAPHEPEVGRVSVFVRARPLNEREKQLNSPQCLLFHEGKVVRIYKKEAPKLLNDGDGGRSFTFDCAYDSNTEQQKVYEDMGVPVLDASLKGFNTCIFAYGQTGSGKSYCMMGPSGGREVSVDPGIIPRLSKNLFTRVAAMREENRIERESAKADALEPHAFPPELTIVVLISYMEIYQEKVNCLLNSKSDSLRVREHPVLGVYVEGLAEVQVDSEESIVRFMNGGNQSRHIAATKMNDRSSRSHAIFAISVIQKRKSVTKEGAPLTTELRSKINLVDLAGSERAKSTGAEGDTLREGATINKSLTVLGTVISALAELSKKPEGGSVKHVPFRDSTLTYILKESLGGNSKTFMLSTLSPAAANYEETLGTLRYADRAKSIVTRAIINETAGDKRIRELEDEIVRLREKMRHYADLVQKGVVQNRKTLTGISSSCGETDSKVIEDDEINYIEAETPRQWRDAALIEAEMRRTQGLIQKISTGEGRPLNILEFYRTMPTVKVHRNDPFILNVDAVGEWVLEHLVADITYLGTATTLPEDDEGMPKKNESSAPDRPAARCMVVSGPRASGIAPRHCCFIRSKDGRVLLRPLDGNRTFLNDCEGPVLSDTPLENGAIVCLGNEYVEFKFTDPAAPPATARRRGGGATGVGGPTSGGEATSGGGLTSRGEATSGGGLVSGGGATSGGGLTSGGEAASGGGATGGGGLASGGGLTSGGEATSGGGLTSGGEATSGGGLTSRGEATSGGGLVSGGEAASGGGATGGGGLASGGGATGGGGLTSGESSTTGGGVVTVVPASAVSAMDNSAVASLAANSALPPVPLVPTLRLKEALQRKQPSQQREYTTTARMTPRTATTTGRIIMDSPEEMRIIYRHTLLFLGACNAGKSASAENIRKKDKWYFHLFPREQLNMQATFGVSSSMVQTSGPHSVHLQLMELGGCDCFSMLEGLLPTRRVTFVFCFSLCDRPTLQSMQPFLDFILSHTTNREPSVVLIGTHSDEATQDKTELEAILAEVASDVNNHFHMLQDIPQMRPSIVGTFAVDNVKRVVFSPGVVQITTFPALLSWLAEHSIQRCRNDTEFPNAQVPKRVLQLAKRVRELHHEGRWCLSSSEYKTISKAVDSRYGASLDGLHRHTQLLHSWGILHHHYRHLTMKRHIVLDVPWVMRVIAVLACCSPVGPNYFDDLGFVGRSTTLLTCRSALKNMKHILPFDGDEVLTSDVYNLLPRGVVSMRTAGLLFRQVLAEKNFTSGMLTGLLDLLRSYDLIVTGSRLVLSDFFEKYNKGSTCKRVESAKSFRDSKSPKSTDSLDTSPPPIPDTFFLIPACFNAQVPSAFSLHVPSFLFGPFYRFTLSIVPRQFFARVICRVAQYADKVYVGPATARSVQLTDVLDSNSCDGYNRDTSSTVVGKSEFWECTAWIISSPSGRALLRMVNHSLYVTFHNTEDDNEFYDGLQHVVRNIIYETSGVKCEESLLCLYEYIDDKDMEGEQHSDNVYWRAIDENVNSLEKIREREQHALQTARVGHRVSLYNDQNGDGEEDDDDVEKEDDIVIPFVRDPLGVIDEEASVKRMCEESLLTDDILNEVRDALHSMNIERSGENSSSRGEGCMAIDKLVHALARA